MMEHTTDELIPPTRGVDWSDNGVWRSLYQHNWDPAHSNILNAWNSLNQNAYRAGVIIETGDVSSTQKAEAKFIRAFNRFYVMDMWGQMPVRNVTDGVSVNPVVKTRSEAFDLIEGDLKDAVAGLPTTGPFLGTVGTASVPNPTATRGAANMMLARLYLNKAVYKAASAAGPYTFDPADMQKVINYVDAMKADGFGLNDDYFATYRAAGSNEVVLSSQQGSPQNRVYMTLHYGQNPSGWNGFATLADFYNKFDAGDKRRGVPAGSVPGLAKGDAYYGIGLGFLTGQQIDDKGADLVDSRTGLKLAFTSDVPLSGAATAKGYRVMKYHPAFYSKYILLRYADAYLMKVEAMFRMNGGGLTELNALRTLRGAPSLGTITLDAILDERGREMYWEGVRRMDLIRFGKFNADWSEKGANKDAFRVLFTIPQQALDSNPNLKQNPGYGGA